MDDLVVNADGPTLSGLRQRSHEELQFRLHRQTDRNLTGLAPGVIEDALA